MIELRKALHNTNIAGTVRFDEPMHRHTSFRVGGPADCYVAPLSHRDIGEALSVANRLSAPVFVLGGGANILVSDAGIAGIVIDLKRINYCYRSENRVVAAAGAEMSVATEVAAKAELSGLEFIHGMPGSVGGSVWMNARCYGVSIAEVLVAVDVIDSSEGVKRHPVDVEAFDYKVSPFQKTDGVIVEATFALTPGDTTTIRKTMEERFKDRTDKGHFRAPSVGSVFKNNREFGGPTGKILDELGLRGYCVGGARVADYHANIVVNTGGATASDILAVIKHAESIALEHRGIELEREVRLVGRWEE